MPRIPYLSDTDINVNPDLLIAIKQRRLDRRLLNLDRILLYSEPVTAGWNMFFSCLRQNPHFSSTIRELIILYIAILNRSLYEFTQHHAEALKTGVSQEKIDALPLWEESVLFDKQEQAVLAYVKAMTITIQVPDTVFAALEHWFDKQQVVEITAVIAGINMVSRFVEALQITMEGE